MRLLGFLLCRGLTSGGSPGHTNGTPDSFALTARARLPKLSSASCKDVVLGRARPLRARRKKNGGRAHPAVTTANRAVVCSSREKSQPTFPPPPYLPIMEWTIPQSPCDRGGVIRPLVMPASHVTYLLISSI